jgi:hypothetical protein
MPKELTHWLVAEQAFQQLSAESAVGAIIARHRPAYLGGAVLPDTLAHIFRGPFDPTARQLGHRFHDPQGNSYQPLIDAEQRLSGDLPQELLACFLGVISHIEADVALHPFVYSATGGAGIGGHYRLETAIDVHFLRRGSMPAERRLERLLSEGARDVMVTAARHLFDPHEQLPREALEQAVELHCRFQGLYDRTLWKMAVRVLGRVCGSPFREQQHLFYPLRSRKMMTTGNVGEWRHPETGEGQRSSVDDLVRQAVQRTMSVFQRIEAEGSLAAALAAPPGANLLTGIHGVTKTTSRA